MLKFFRKRDGEDREEVTYEEALKSLLTTYKDNDLTRDMLTVVNRILYRYGTISVEDHISPIDHLVYMAGYFNASPEGVEYDDDGNRVRG